MATPTLRDANIVILAQSYNPSIVSKEWLARKRIITEPVVNFVHIPPMSHVETSSIRLIIREERMQLGLVEVSDQRAALLPAVATSFVAALPETPYTAVGLNFAFTIPASDCRLSELLSPDVKRIRALLDSEYSLGVLLSFEFGYYRVRMTAPPAVHDHTETDGLVLDFNFHADTKGVRAVKARLRDYATALGKAREVAGGICA